MKTATDKAYAVSVLIIDDNEVWRQSVRNSCCSVFDNSPEDLNIVEAATIDEGLSALSSQHFHVVLLDKELINSKEQMVNGIDFITEILSIQPNVQLLMFTATDDPRDIVRALQLGASGYLLKEGKEGYEEYRKHQLRLALNRAKISADHERLLRQNGKGDSGFVAVSSSMRRLENQLGALAEVSKPVLILGATGLGKGAGAKKLHTLRSEFLGQTNRPFFNINIANLSGDMALSELFGHEPNSFTGSSNKTKQGYFELANGGDLFLDEVAEASLELQARLLKVIEEREYQRVGGNRTLKSTARLIFATNRDLKQMVLDGSFREDLYMRISTFVVEMPSLEERKEDVPSLIKVFLSRINTDRSGEPLHFEDLPSDFVDHLLRDGIPGNIRGLESDLSRVVYMSPKDKNNKPNLGAWKSVLGVSKKYTPVLQSPTGAITLDQFLKLPTDFIKPGFPGLTEIKRLIEKKLLLEAEKKFDQLQNRASALQIKISNASHKYTALKKEQESKGGSS